MTDITVRAIDIDDDSELERFIAFQTAHGTPRHTMAQARAAAPALHAQLLLVAEEGGELVGCGNGNLLSASGGEPVIGNLFCLPGRHDALLALIEHIRTWPEAKTATKLYVYVSNPTEQQREDIVAAGCTFGGDRFRLRRAITADDLALDVGLHDGIEFTSMAQRPDLAPDLVAAWNEVAQDIPSPIAWATLDTAQVRAHLELPADGQWPAGVRIAVDTATDTIAAFSALIPMPGTSGAAYANRMTGVLRARRGTGLAYAVKLDGVRWAARAGARELLTTNDTDNAAMRAVNERLGFETVFVITVYEIGLR